jgi:hypothetical protein
VHRDGRWLDGELRGWRRGVDGWLGFVAYAESPGVRYLEWVAAERAREVCATANGTVQPARLDTYGTRSEIRCSTSEVYPEVNGTFLVVGDTAIEPVTCSVSGTSPCGEDLVLSPDQVADAHD